VRNRNRSLTLFGKNGFYLDVDTLDALHAEAKASGKSLSAVARRYIKAGLPYVRALPGLGVDTNEPVSTSVPAPVYCTVQNVGKRCETADVLVCQGRRPHCSAKIKCGQQVRAM
jgi:hypothetical protein